jgi:hypothetical protein
MSEQLQSRAAFVNFAFGEAYVAQQGRWADRLRNQGCEAIALNILPSAPSHAQSPFAFKAYAILEAWKSGVRIAIWSDADVAFNEAQKVAPMVEERGLLFFRSTSLYASRWCCEAALPELGIRRQEIRGVPHVSATVFGLDARSSKAVDLITQWVTFSEKTKAFQGAKFSRRRGEIFGHRHDGTVAAVVLSRLDVKPCFPVKGLFRSPA